MNFKVHNLNQVFTQINIKLNNQIKIKFSLQVIKKNILPILIHYFKINFQKIRIYMIKIYQRIKSLDIKIIIKKTMKILIHRKNKIFILIQII